ncbi:MAG: acyl-CoA dehydrogenase family protein [Chloroflexota bacterium]
MIEDYYNLAELSDEQIRLLRLADKLGRENFAPRTFEHDDQASFPTENYNDLREHDFLKLCVPKDYGGLGADFWTYAMVSAEIGKHCGATALTFNMHTSAMLWSTFMPDMDTLTEAERAHFKHLREKQYRRVVEDGAIYSQPISEGGNNWTSIPIQTNCRKVDGGYVINGFKKFASLAGNCDYYCILCTEHFEGQEPSHEDTMLFSVHKDTPGLDVIGDWNPLGMRGTVSRDLVLKDVFVSDEELMMPPRTFIKTLSYWPHMYASLTPSYMGIAQGAHDFTVQYLSGSLPDQRPIDRRVYPTKRAAVARMYTMLMQTRALWYQAMKEAKPFPSKAEVLRLYAATYTTMENANAITALAIRTCGGQSMLKTLPLERMYRDSRCGSLMLPYTAEIMEDYLSVLTLYEVDEVDGIAADTVSARSSMYRPFAKDF